MSILQGKIDKNNNAISVESLTADVLPVYQKYWNLLDIKENAIDAHALTMILSHGAKYPHGTISGILLGNGTTVTDVIPLTHTTLTAPLIDMAILMTKEYIKQHCRDIVKIMGLYVGPSETIQTNYQFYKNHIYPHTIEDDGTLNNFINDPETQNIEKDGMNVDPIDDVDDIDDSSHIQSNSDETSIPKDHHTSKDNNESDEDDSEDEDDTTNTTTNNLTPSPSDNNIATTSTVEPFTYSQLLHNKLNSILDSVEHITKAAVASLASSLTELDEKQKSKDRSTRDNTNDEMNNETIDKSEMWLLVLNNENININADDKSNVLPIANLFTCNKDYISALTTSPTNNHSKCTGVCIDNDEKCKKLNHIYNIGVKGGLDVSLTLWKSVLARGFEHVVLDMEEWVEGDIVKQVPCCDFYQGIHGGNINMTLVNIEGDWLNNKDFKRLCKELNISK